MRMKLLLAVMFLAIISWAYAQEAEGGDSLTAKNELGRAEKVISEMENAGFNTTRVKDIYQTATQLYEAQAAFEAANGTGNYADVISKVAEIVSIKNLAFEVSDELNGLKDTIAEREKDFDLSEPKSLYEEAKADLQAERYENAKERISEAYKKIAEIEASTTTTKVLARASITLKEKIMELWKELLVAAAIIAITSFVGFNRIFLYIQKIKMEKLLLEKRIIEELLHTAQNDYFNKGKLSETTYHIKIKKYGELIRDINRQIPLIREEIEEMQHGWWKRSKKKK